MVSKPTIIPRLVIIEGKDKGKVITLSDGTAVIGRSKGDIVIQDARISRSHIALHFDSRTGKLTFTDLKSLNGTVINGEPTEAGELKDGDKLQIGNTLFDCQIGPAGEEGTSTAEILARTRERQKKPDGPKPSKSPQPAPQFKAPEEQKNIPLENEATNAREQARGVPESEKPTRLTVPSLGGVRAVYQKIPPRLRTILLSLIIIAAGLKYLSTADVGKNVSGGGEDLDKELAVIRQLQQQGKFDEALARLEPLKTAFPDHSDVYMEGGNIFTALGKNPEAVAEYGKAHLLPPEQPLVHIKLIRVYLRSGMPRQAGEELSHVERVISEKKFSRELFVEAAYLFLEFKELKQPPEKTLILSKALQKEYAPDSSIGYKLEAQLHFQENRPQEALAAMDKGRVIDPQDEWLIENSVFAKLALKDYTGAETLLEDWLRLKPAATKALLVLGYLRFNEKNYAGAMPYVQKILQIAVNNPQDPYYPEALNLMAQIHQGLGKPDEAAKFFKQGCAAGFQQSCEQGQGIARGNEPGAAPGTNGGNGSNAPAPASLPQGVESSVPLEPPPQQPNPPASQQIVDPPDAEPEIQ